MIGIQIRSAFIVGVALALLTGCAPPPVSTGAPDTPAADSPTAAGDEKAAQAGAETFLSAVGRHDYSAALASMSTGARPFNSSAALGRVIAGLEKSHGRILRHDGPQSSHEASGEGTTTMLLSYKMIFQHGETTVTLVLLNETGAWHTQSYQFAL